MMTNLEALFAGERHHYLPITYRWILVAFLSAGAIRWHDQFGRCTIPQRRLGSEY
jgi:hypothetical protein